MKRVMVFTIATVVGIALAACVLHDDQQQEAPQKQPQVQSEPIAEMPKSTEDYDMAMTQHERNVLLVFGAEWCPHCSTLKEHLNETDLKGLIVCYVDVDARKDLAAQHRVRVLPTSVLVAEGKETSRTKGFSKASYDRWLQENR